MPLYELPSQSELTVEDKADIAIGAGFFAEVIGILVLNRPDIPVLAAGTLACVGFLVDVTWYVSKGFFRED